MSDFKSIKNKLSSLRAKIKSESTATTTTSTSSATTKTTPSPVAAATSTEKKIKATEPVATPSTTTPATTKTEQATSATTTTTPAADKKKNNNKKAKQQKPKANKKAASTTTPSEDKKATESVTTTPTTNSEESSSTTTTEKPKPAIKKSSAKQNKEKKQGVKRKQEDGSEESSETKEAKKTDKKKNKNKKSKKAIKAAIKTFVLKLEIDNTLINEEKIKECFPEQNAIIRMGPRMILIQFPTEEVALKYLTSASGQVEKNNRTVINGEKFKITKHTVKEIFNPRWYDVKPRVTEGVSLGLEPGQKVNGKFGAYLELHLKEKLGNDVNTSISDMEKGVTVFFDDKTTEQKFKSMLHNGEFKVPAEYINDKKKKGTSSKGPAKKKFKK